MRTLEEKARPAKDRCLGAQSNPKKQTFSEAEGGRPLESAFCKRGAQYSDARPHGTQENPYAFGCTDPTQPEQ